ncbi:4Fe-4S dicluster domain-containing protein [Methanoregula sp.]|uniref:4Fe-4S dicluster domain-containing protein n=1 Tax=Methanoregula sp. TaxID=2052170 RepID=UPI003BB0AC35
MAFAEQIYHEHCTGCSKCVVACPVDALELHTVNPVSNETIYAVRDGKSMVPGFPGEFRAGCGECVQACLHDGIRLTGPWETRAEAKVQ